MVKLGQFDRLKNIHQKKLVEAKQANEYTHWDGNQEGICYMCWKVDKVSGTIGDICYRCAEKKGSEAILAIASRQVYGYCYAHGGYPVREFKFNIAQVNVRVCMRCTRIIARMHRALRKKGVHQMSPFWRSMRRTLGQDYKRLGVDLGESIRR